MLRIKSLCAAVLLVATVVGCGGESASSEGAKAPTNPSDKKTRTGVVVDKAAAETFTSALEDFAAADAKGAWTEDRCKQVAEAFLDASKKQQSATNRPLAEAQYDAGLAYQRCGMESQAREQFEAALATDSRFHRAKVQLALFEFQKTNNVDSAISSLNQIIRDAQYQNVEALVGVAALQMERGGEDSDSDGANDLERAKKNLQRALAIDDSYMPAFNQLALYYLEQAKAKSEKDADSRKRRRRGLVVAGSERNRVNEQMLDLAALVASQAMRKNPKYAPIHNTAGLIQVELQNFNTAVKSFSLARQLDKDFFEAQMNYAAVNLSFRGFEEAEKAYREALRMRPNVYEAHLGLALAIRGQITLANKAKLLPLAEKEIAEAKKLEPTRAETYYNEAILTQEFKAKGVGDEKKSIAMMGTAIQQYEDFVAKASGDSAFADAVKRSKERVQDMRDTIKFLQEGEIARKQAEEDAKKAAAEAKLRAEEEKKAAEEAKKAEEEAKKKAAEDAKKAEADKKAAEDAKKASGGAAKPAAETTKPAAETTKPATPSKK